MDMHLVFKSGTHSPMTAFLLFFLTITTYLLFALVSYLRRKVRKVRGPPRPSFLLGANHVRYTYTLFVLTCIPGHEWIIRQQDTVGDLKMIWYRQYGTVYRIGGCFGVRFFLSRHDFQFPEVFSHPTARCVGDQRSEGLATYFPQIGISFSKGKGHRQNSRRHIRTGARYSRRYVSFSVVALSKESTACLKGTDHQRQRKILNGSFSASQLRQFLSIFQTSASLVRRPIVKIH